MLDKTIKEQLDRRKITKKINIIRREISYGRYYFSSEDIIKIIQDVDKLPVKGFIECGCFRFTKLPKSIEITPRFSFRITKDALDDLFVDKEQPKNIKRKGGLETHG